MAESVQLLHFTTPFNEPFELGSIQMARLVPRLHPGVWRVRKAFAISPLSSFNASHIVLLTVRCRVL